MRKNVHTLNGFFCSCSDIQTRKWQNCVSNCLGDEIIKAVLFPNQIWVWIDTFMVVPKADWIFAFMADIIQADWIAFGSDLLRNKFIWIHDVILTSRSLGINWVVSRMKLVRLGVVAKTKWNWSLTRSFRDFPAASVSFDNFSCQSMNQQAYKRINKQSIFANNFSRLYWLELLWHPEPRNPIPSASTIFFAPLCPYDYLCRIMGHSNFHHQSLPWLTARCGKIKTIFPIAIIEASTIESVICLKLYAIEAVFRDKYRTLWSMLWSSLLQQQLEHVRLFIISI